MSLLAQSCHSPGAADTNIRFVFMLQLMDGVMLQLTRARNRLTTPASMTLPELAASGLMVCTLHSVFLLENNCLCKDTGFKENILRIYDSKFSQIRFLVRAGFLRMLCPPVGQCSVSCSSAVPLTLMGGSS